MQGPTLHAREGSRGRLAQFVRDAVVPQAHDIAQMQREPRGAIRESQLHVAR